MYVGTTPELEGINLMSVIRCTSENHNSTEDDTAEKA
jgi:hypothetical protein